LLAKLGPSAALPFGVALLLLVGLRLAPRLAR